MISLTPSQNPSGDREAAANASRRAERLGAIDPSKIQPAAVRLAVQDAKDLKHLLELLQAVGIEAEFDRRGAAQEVYGWRMRRKGAKEWLKASTLAKDLSWPKIAHRFAQAEAPAAQVTPAAPPSELKSTLAQHLSEQTTQTAQVAKWSWDSRNVIESGALSSPFGIVCAAVAELAAKLIAIGIEIFRAIWAWISKKLGLLGLGGTANEATRSFQIAPQNGIIDVPSRIVPVPLLIKQTAEEINAVADAVAKNDSSLLPKSAQYLAEYFEKQNSAEQVEADPVHYFGDEPELHTAEREQELAKPLAWPALKAAAEAHHLAAQALAKARALALETDDIWGGVPEASKAEDQAHGALLKVQDESKLWLAASFTNRAAAALGGNPYLVDIKAAEALLARHRAELAAAQKYEARKPARPVKHAPIELVFAEKSAVERLAAARVVFMVVARKNLAFVRQNPMQIPLANELETQIQRGIDCYVLARDNSLLESKIAQLKAAVEAERERQNPVAYEYHEAADLALAGTTAPR